MPRFRRPSFAICLAAAIAACGQPNPGVLSPPDGGGPVLDAGESPDAGFDPDAGLEPDAGTEPDAGWAAPETMIDSAPPALVASSSAQFTFSSDGPDRSFECALDGTPFSACASPVAYAALDDGPHHFSVRAVDARGTPDASPANHAWVIDTVAPETTLTSTPQAGSDPAVFTFTSDDPNATFECSLDSSAFAPCTTPAGHVGLAVGSHTFEVRAVDDAGNVDASPAQFTWTVPSASSTVLRIMAANITSGNNQSYDPGNGTRIFQGLVPDVVLIQEFNYGNNSEAAIRGFVDTAFGPEYFYFREAGAQIPNGVVSRYPIIAAGEWTDTQVSNRDFAWARIDVPGPKDLWAVSVHLLTANASVRNTEAGNLVNFINTHVPASDYLVVGGDFNTASRTEACISTLRQVVVAQAPWPADQNGIDGTNASRSKPYDWVLADADLDPLETTVQIGSSTYPNGLVFDSRVYSPLSEVTPVLASDSGASNMQHMAVVRDFLISP